MGRPKKTIETISDVDFEGFEDSDFINDPYFLDKELKAELESKGLVGRFVNIKKLEMYGGRHNSGWVPYKRESKDPMGIFGSDPDGFVRRGMDLVLAVKPVALQKKHKKKLHIEATRSKAQTRIKGEKQRFKDYFNEHGLRDKVTVVDD